MSDWFDLGLFGLGIFVVLGLTALAVRCGYWLGYSDGQRAGFRDGCSFGMRKVREQQHQDGYGSYN